MGPYGPIRALWAHMGPNPDRAPTRTGPQPGPGPGNKFLVNPFVGPPIVHVLVLEGMADAKEPDTERNRKGPPATSTLIPSTGKRGDYQSGHIYLEIPRKTYFYLFLGIFKVILIKYLNFWSK